MLVLLLSCGGCGGGSSSDSGTTQDAGASQGKAATPTVLARAVCLSFVFFY